MPTEAAVVIPIYQSKLSAAEIFSVQNAVAVLTRHDIFLIGPEHLRGFLDSLAIRFDKPLKVRTFPDRYFVSIAGYNKLMMSIRLYEAFIQYQYILIAQTDSLVFRDELNLWIKSGYSYIGAPWFEGYTQPTQPLQLTSVGNGGFSLRSVPDFLRVLRHPRIFKNVLMQDWPGNWLSNVYRFVTDYFSFSYKNRQINVKVNEDLFWGLFVTAQCTFFKVPPVDEARSFAFEAYPEHLYQLNHEKLPFGCHAWLRYQPDFWARVLHENKKMDLDKFI